MAARMSRKIAPSPHPKPSPWLSVELSCLALWKLCFCFQKFSLWVFHPEEPEPGLLRSLGLGWGALSWAHSVLLQGKG